MPATEGLSHGFENHPLDPAIRRSRSGRWGQLLLGLFLFGLSIALMVKSGLGLGPWDAFHVGVGRMTFLTIGGATIVVGLAILCGTWFLGVRPGPGTIANMVLIGLFIDLLLPLIPEVQGWILRLCYHTIGIVLMGVATGMYIAARLGEGPRDGLMLGLAKATGFSVATVRTSIEVIVLVLGWMMGATVGVGTMLFALAIGPVVSRSLRIFGAVEEVGHGQRSSPEAPACT